MSEHQQGPGWWLASDGRWYPPDQAPAVPPAETWPSAVEPAAPARRGLSGLAIAGIAIGGLLVLVVALVAIVQVLGTEADDEPAPEVAAATLPDGFSTLKGDDVSIAAPASWELVDAESFAGDADDFAEAFPDAPPEMIEQGLQLFEQGAVLVAFDFSGGAFASNLNVLKAPGEIPLDLAESQGTTQIESLGGEIIDAGGVDLPAGQAVRIRYRLPITTPGGSTVQVEGVQFYVPSGGSTHVLTVTALDAIELADQMAETFRVH